MKGLVFDLQRYSIHDGPGIRTVVFLKGCPLQCQWCCNPESQRMMPELEFRFSLCQQCGQCISACPVNAVNPDVTVQPMQKIDRNICTLCGECVKVCPTGALRMAGQWLESNEIMDRCLQDADAYRRSGGGVTLSGGEPLAQPDFSVELLQQLYDRNIHTSVETTGFGSWENLEKFLPVTDLFLFDIKHLNPQIHLQLTGVSNQLILHNLENLVNHSANIILRIPVIPGLNDDRENMEKLLSLAMEYSIKEVHLMPFHQLGREKYDRIGENYLLKSLPAVFETPGYLQKMDTIRSAFIDRGIEINIGG